MPNKTYALEWLKLAFRNLETARLLIRENHFTDSIAIEIQQSIEKAFKTTYAYNGVSIPKTHSLIFLSKEVRKHIDLDFCDFDDLLRISDYYEVDRYPGPRYEVPSREEVNANFVIAESIYKAIRQYIEK
jgi:HEPN domain-containing protein